MRNGYVLVDAGSVAEHLPDTGLFDVAKSLAIQTQMLLEYPDGQLFFGWFDGELVSSSLITGF